ncbi:RNA-directed DNA polymerase [Pseudoduganella eburnea]|uniref:RNA-directed DNA polymerase n=1 Tax=Massilia eburnea TaxID=1776165 RepID=A0A6L6QJN1_9BURK|nr:reverse transcriptase family protein [Massilia eburnea]MTW12582.1 RNA-directed DNA polymerase [Massilia eburnea]
MNTEKLTALALADMMLATDGSMASLVAACHRVFDSPQPWSATICAALIERTGDNFHYFSRHELAHILLLLTGRRFDDFEDGDDEPSPPLIELPAVRRYCLNQPIRPPKPAWLASLALPELKTVGDLAGWLNEPVGALAWLADQWRLAGDEQSRLQHYHYRWVPKRGGGLRLIEIPKARLRRIQHKILRQILDLAPPHPCAHGFRHGHSSVTHAALHAGKNVIIRMDLKDFFPSIQASRIHALFEKLGYPPSVAGTLARMCVNRAPRGIFRDKQTGGSLPWSERQALQSPHLPQGSPCSPALANLSAYRLDIRLASLAQSLGASYSRYADDLAFSGGPDLARAADRFHIQVAAIALEEGFRINTRKTRVMRKGTRQEVAGVVVNSHPNLARGEYDLLKAILTNCVRHGPASQNRHRHPSFRAHLAGRISYVKMLNANRAVKLQRLFETIEWAD